MLALFSYDTSDSYRSPLEGMWGQGLFDVTVDEYTATVICLTDLLLWTRRSLLLLESLFLCCWASSAPTSLSLPSSVWAWTSPLVAQPGIAAITLFISSTPTPQTMSSNFSFEIISTLVTPKPTSLPISVPTQHPHLDVLEASQT